MTRFHLIVTAVLLFAPPACAQESMGTPASKAKLEAARAAMKAGDFSKAILELKAGIETDPNFVELHDQLRSADMQLHRGDPPGSKDHHLEKLYEDWAARFPDKAAFLWKLADLNLYDDYRKTEDYATRAIKIDPKFAPAYMMLSLVEEARGNEKKHIEYLRLAADAAPEDPSWIFYYANALRSSNPALYRSTSLEVARRFPAHERGAQALYWLGENSVKQEEAVAYFEQLRTSYPPDKFSWSDSGMSGLFNIYSQTDPQKALALAREMSGLMPANKSWQAFTVYQENLVKAGAMVSAGNAADAVKLLESAKPPRLLNSSPYYLTLAAAHDAAGSAQAAYECLLAQMAQSPTDVLKDALQKYGAKAGRSSAQVTGDLGSQLQKNAKPAPELVTTRFGDEKKLTLADYKGKVVLLNFWYPFCGPCRGEFPYLQAILDKYTARGLVIVSPSVHPAEDALVLPYMTGMHWGFIPVHSTGEYAEKAYGARGFPSNYLIDQEGRILYKPGVIRGGEAQRGLEIQIETLLQHSSGAAPLEANRLEANRLDADRPVDAAAVIEPATVPAGGHGTLKIALELMEGGHANSNVTADPNLIPTSFTPKPVAGIVWGKPVYPEAKSVTEWYSTDPLSVFVDGAVISVPFTVEQGAANSVVLSGALLAQVCDHDQCYPPRRVTVTAPLRIEGGGGR
jgi:tetratricopeptide (TPR) repeat protein/thiol-disulfide isomerase/thioredoxin